MNKLNEETVEIYTPATELEGNLICDTLNSKGIKAQYITGLKNLWDSIYVKEAPVGKVIVFKRDADKAGKIIEEYLDELKSEANADSAASLNTPSFERDPMENVNEETVEIYKPKNELEANIIRDILKQDDIESGFKSNWSSWYDGIFVSSMGWGSIFVFKKDADRAKKLLEEYFESLKDNPDFDDEKMPE